MELNGIVFYDGDMLHVPWRLVNVLKCVYIYIHTYINTHTYIYIYLIHFCLTVQWLAMQWFFPWKFYILQYRLRKTFSTNIRFFYFIIWKSRNKHLPVSNIYSFCLKYSNAADAICKITILTLITLNFSYVELLLMIIFNKFKSDAFESEQLYSTIYSILINTKRQNIYN